MSRRRLRQRRYANAAKNLYTLMWPSGGWGGYSNLSLVEAERLAVSGATKRVIRRQASP